MISFIEDNQVNFGVEPICRVLPIAPSTWYACAALKRTPDLASARVKRDNDHKVAIKRVYNDSG